MSMFSLEENLQRWLAWREAGVFLMKPWRNDEQFNIQYIHNY